VYRAEGMAHRSVPQPVSLEAERKAVRPKHHACAGDAYPLWRVRLQDTIAPMALKTCPKCSQEGRDKMTRWHVVGEDHKLYLECERKKDCGWRIQIVVVSKEDHPDAPLPML